jgi:hypothetical protein
MTMGLAKQSSEQDTTSEFQGIVGVGFDTGEAIYSQTQTATQAGVTYPNIISQLVNQGFIKTKAYSLWLNDRGKNVFRDPQNTANNAQNPTLVVSSSVVSTMPNSTATSPSCLSRRMSLVVSHPLL